MSIVKGEYTSFKHIKGRKCVTLEIEVPLEYFPLVVSRLGMPVGEFSTPVAIALLDNKIINAEESIASVLIDSPGSTRRAGSYEMGSEDTN